MVILSFQAVDGFSPVFRPYSLTSYPTVCSTHCEGSISDSSFMRSVMVRSLAFTSSRSADRSFVAIMSTDSTAFFLPLGVRTLSFSPPCLQESSGKMTSLPAGSFSCFTYSFG